MLLASGPINPENYADSVDFILSSKATHCWGHFEIEGALMMPGMTCQHGLDHTYLKRFDKVYSGHFHQKSEVKNIKYLGSQMEFTWSDYGDTKGFHIFDTETREIEFIPNTNTIFSKLLYNDTETDYDNFDISPFNNKFVKLIVVSKKNNEMFNRLLDKLYSKINVHELKILEDYSDLNANLVSDDVVEGTEDTMTLVNNYVDQLPVDLDKNKLKSMIKETFLEAQDDSI